MGAIRLQPNINQIQVRRTSATFHPEPTTESLRPPAPASAASWCGGRVSQTISSPVSLNKRTVNVNVLPLKNALTHIQRICGEIGNASAQCVTVRYCALL